MADAPNIVQPDTTATPQLPTSDQGASATAVTPNLPPTAPSTIPDGAQLPLAPRSNAPALTPVPAPAPTPGHGILGSIFQDLAGGKKTVWTQTENGPVATKVDLKPGEMARGILAAALTGMAAGSMPGAGQGAFGAGFEANAKRVDTNAEKAQKQAQQTFQNKQAADELTIRKQQSILMQQEGIKQLQRDDDLHVKSLQDIQNGNFDFSQKVLRANQEQANLIALQEKSGMIPLTDPTGKPIPTFSTPSLAKAWANANPTIAVKKNGYYNVPTQDPTTHEWVVMEVPKTWEDLQWLGVITDSNGKPKISDGTDKDADGKLVPKGNMIANGDFRSHGKATVPGGQMSQHSLYDSQVGETKLLTDEVNYKKAQVELQQLEEGYKKNANISRAQAEFNRAGGDPLAIDPETHEYIMSPTSKEIMGDVFVNRSARLEKIRHDTTIELENMGNPKPGTPEYLAWKDAMDSHEKAQTLLNQIQNQALVMGGNQNVATTMADSLIKENTHPDGFDQKGADEALNKMNLESGKAQAIRQQIELKTSGRTAKDFLTTPEALNTVLSVMKDQIKNGSNIDAEIAKIKTHPEYSLADIAKLTEALKQVPAPPPVGLNPVGQAIVTPVNQGARASQTPAMQEMSR